MSADFDLANLLSRAEVIAAMKVVIDQHENGVCGVSPSAAASLNDALRNAYATSDPKATI